MRSREEIEKQINTLIDEAGATSSAEKFNTMMIQFEVYKLVVLLDIRDLLTKKEVDLVDRSFDL